MSPRPYRMAERAATAERTRDRLVEATMALHRERGIAATTTRDIAGRAGVGVGTIHHHFPTYEEAIRACGARTATLARLPTSDIFQGTVSLRARVAALVRELFAYYERIPTLARARCDQDRLPVLAESVSAREEAIRGLVAEALVPAHPLSSRVATVVALTDFPVLRSLVAAGIAAEEAARQITEVICDWLSREGSRKREANHEG